MATFEARKVLMKDAQGRYVIPFTGAVETVNGQKPDENGNVVIEGVDTTTLLTKTAAAETYLSKADAASTYLRVDTAADTFLNKTDAASEYLKVGTAADTFLSKADASSTYLTPAQANATYLGIGDKAVSAETADNAVSATMASKAISDINGNAIATTYATNQKLFQNDGAGPLLRSDVMPIKTVNGQEPDASGNIQVGTGDAYESDILEAADKALETVSNVGNTDIADVLSAVASVEANLSEKLDRNDKAEIVSWGMPDYDAGVSKAINVTHTADVDGFLLIHAQTDHIGVVYVAINGKEFLITRSFTNGNSNEMTIYPLPKGTVYSYRIESSAAASAEFYPCKGAN